MVSREKIEFRNMFMQNGKTENKANEKIRRLNRAINEEHRAGAESMQQIRE